MGVKNDDPRVAALQLLLGDLDAADWCAIINAAFDHDMLVIGANARQIKQRISDSIHTMDDIAQTSNGETPLGRHAQERIKDACLATAATLTRVKLLLS
jgi:hypothetical protein